MNWSKVTKTESCWLWNGAKLPSGYGVITKDSKNDYAHRAAYKELVGEIPEGLTIDHLCRVKNCVNPAHIEVVTRGENAARGGGLEAAQRKRREQTECCRGHRFTQENTRIKSNGTRQCAICYRMWYTIRNARRKGRGRVEVLGADKSNRQAA